MNQPGYPNTSCPAQTYTNQINNGGLSGGMYGGLAGYNPMMNGYGPATGRTYQSVLNPFAHSILTPTYGTEQEQGARRSRSPLPAPPDYRDRSTVLSRPDTGSRLLPGSSDDVGNDPPAGSSSEGDHQNVIRATRGKMRIGCDRCRLMHIECDILDLPVSTKSCTKCEESPDRTANNRCVMNQANENTDLRLARVYKQKQTRMAQSFLVPPLVKTFYARLSTSPQDILTIHQMAPTTKDNSNTAEISRKQSRRDNKVNKPNQTEAKI